MAAQRNFPNRSRIATYIDPENRKYLKALSDAARLPAGRILDQALDAFFKDIKWREPVTAPVDKRHLAEVTRQIPKP
jgi:hypothetical protein